MAAAREGFLTDEQREVLKTATQSTEILSSSPKSPSWLMAEHQIKAPAGERAGNVGIAVRHVRRSHSGKFARVKKGLCVYYFVYIHYMFIYVDYRYPHCEFNIDCLFLH